MNWQLGVTGYLEIILSGLNPERVINMAMSRGIYIWDIHQDEEGRFLLKVRLGGFKALRYLVRRSGCRMRIKSKKGVPFLVMRAKKRKILVLGFLFFCLTLYFLSSFVWFVEVSGNTKVPTAIIMQNVENNGLKVGAVKSALEKVYIKEKLLLDIPELAYVDIYEQGSKIVIEVAEKTLIPQNKDTLPSDLLARIDGKVEELLVLQGTPLVKEGDQVQQGQALISGLYYPQIQVNEDGSITPSGLPETVRARGLIRGRVLHKVQTQCFLREESTQDTGNEFVVTIVSWQGRQVVVKGEQKVPYEFYRLIRQTKTLFWGRNPGGPVELITIVYREQVRQVQEWGLAGAYQEAIRRARTEVEKSLPADYRIISERAEPLTSPDNNLVRALYMLETVEDIGCYPSLNQGVD